MATTGTDHRELVTRLTEEVWEQGRLDRIDEYVAADYVEHNPALPEEIRGREGYRQNVERFRTAFPDISFEEEDIVVEDDKVVVRVTARGTHEGELLGKEPTGNEVEVSGMDFYRIADGKVAEAWIQVDMLGMLDQLGIEPPEA